MHTDGGGTDVSQTGSPIMKSTSSVIVIGASAGNVEAIRTVVAALPRDLNAAVFVTLHIGAHRSDLPWLLTRAGPLAAKHPAHGDEIEAGQIYVAPPDHHMLVEEGRIGLTKGPRENWARPAIDPLVRSAARAYGSRVIGVILSGGLNDGTAGMIEIKARGGTAVVQDPLDAFTPNMPSSIIANVDVDYVMPVSAIGALLARLIDDADAVNPGSETAKGDLQEDGTTAEFTHHPPVAITCPDCGGALRRSELGNLTQFTCHIGHVYTTEVMLAAQFVTMERSLEMAMRSLGERAELCRQMFDKLPAGLAHDEERSRWGAARSEALDRTQPLRQLLTEPWTHPSNSLLETRRES